MKTKILLYENDQRELRLELAEAWHVDESICQPYEVDSGLVERYNTLMTAYNAMQKELSKIRGEE